jgi:hypothetical protein
VSLASGAVDLRLRPGKDLVLEVVRPPGWSGWPTLQASAPGIVVFGTWTPNGDCVFAGLPDVEFLVTAEGRDQDRREVAGEIRVRPPAAATLLLRLR